jgi:hypothetical protein
MVVKSLVWPSNVASPGAVLEESYFHCSLLVMTIFACIKN